MSDRSTLLEATFNLLEEAVVIFDQDSTVSFWNRAAKALTGYTAEDIAARPSPDDLYQIDEGYPRPLPSGLVPDWPGASAAGVRYADESPRPKLVSLRHKLGYLVPGTLRKIDLRYSADAAHGIALLFYPAEEALPHGDCAEDLTIERSQSDMEDRLDAAHYQWHSNRTPFGILWVTVDQAASLRKSHGQEACEAMLRSVEHTLVRQMKPSEVIGRWGSNEFLVLTHEPTADLLDDRARRLAGLSRTADFRWWGDRVGITVSVGAGLAAQDETLRALLQRTGEAMHASEYAGGNQVTRARQP